jgi:hypothetical protein
MTLLLECSRTATGQTIGNHLKLPDRQRLMALNQRRGLEEYVRNSELPYDTHQGS